MVYPAFLIVIKNERFVECYEVTSLFLIIGLTSGLYDITMHKLEKNRNKK